MRVTDLMNQVKWDKEVSTINGVQVLDREAGRNVSDSKENFGEVYELVETGMISKDEGLHKLGISHRTWERWAEDTRIQKPKKDVLYVTPFQIALTKYPIKFDKYYISCFSSSMSDFIKSKDKYLDSVNSIEHEQDQDVYIKILEWLVETICLVQRTKLLTHGDMYALGFMMEDFKSGLEEMLRDDENEDDESWE